MRDRVPALFIALLLPALASAQTKTEAYSLDRMVVTGKRPAAADQEGPDGIRTYDESEIDSSGAFTLQEFLDTLPRGADGEEQLILVDGVPTELSALTPAMVAAIEVSYSGAMPQYGAYSRGRIINIRLKTEYDGREIGARQTGSLHADAWRREASFSWGSIRGPWRVTYSAEYNRTDPVTAAGRDFSRGQDNRARGGRDFRVPWGDAAAVQAVAGNLNGIFDSAGNPVRVALVPEDANGPLLPAQFIAGTGPSASGQRFFNTSPYLYLARPEETLSANVNVTRTFKQLRLGFTANHRVNESDRDGPPPVTPASPATLVPAAFSPFGQDVLVGLVHTGFGPVRQHSEGTGTRVSLSATWIPASEGRRSGPRTDPTGRLPMEPASWRVTGNLTFNRTHAENDARDLDPAAFTTALASPNASSRFNPFVPSDSALNAALYPSLAIHRVQENTNRNTRFNGLASGPIAPGWGAGPIRMTFTGTAAWRQDERTSRNQRGVADGTSRNDDANYRLTNFTEVPLRRERPWVHRLDGRLNASYAMNRRGGDSRRGGAGVFYAPVRAWTMRATFGWSASSPGERGDDDPESSIETLMDPRRTPGVAENVQVISRRSSSTQASRGNDMQLGLSYSPAWRPGLQFNAGYSQQLSSRATGSPFRPQDVIDNETLFAGRITREAPTAADLILGQPGRILVVDTTATAVASDERRVFDFGVEFTWPAPPAMAGPGSRGGGARGVAVGRGRGLAPAGMPGPRGGVPAAARNPNRFMLSIDGEYPLAARYEVAEGRNFVSRDTGPANRPEWTARGNLRWNNRRWSASLNVRHNAVSRLGTIPAVTSVGADVGYRFETPFWGKFGRNVRLRLGAQNIGNDTPPYADTILGYRGGSAIGTTVNFSMSVPW